MGAAPGKNGRPTVVVTGMGVITSLGAGKEENWAKLIEGSPASIVSRGFRTRASRRRSPALSTSSGEPFCSTRAWRTHGGHLRQRRLSPRRALERRAISQVLCFWPWRRLEIEWLHRDTFAAASGADDSIGYDDLLRASASGRFHAIP